ncbi:hypothetical protein L1887_23046 [Cichorium endivia]|nr:hypothetical protein L1887_23046 [Cichorium endivia]
MMTWIYHVVFLGFNQREAMGAIMGIGKPSGQMDPKAFLLQEFNATAQERTVAYSNGLVKVYEILDPMELNNCQLQVWEFDQYHQRWLPVAELADNDDKGDQIFSMA